MAHTKQPSSVMKQFQRAGLVFRIHGHDASVQAVTLNAALPGLMQGSAVKHVRIYRRDKRET